MYKMFVKYTKVDRMKFISHLELIRVIERALRRADVPLKFTQGYNPHPMISFAAPLSVGVSSEGEYLTVELMDEIEVAIFQKVMNDVLPNGIKFIMCKYIDPKSKSLMSLTEYSNYVIMCSTERKYSNKDIESKINHFLNREEIMYKKIGKKNKVRDINIKTLIKDLYLLSSEENEIILKTTIASGSKGNLKPEVLIDKLAEMDEIILDSDRTRFHRLELLISNSDSKLIPLERVLNN